MARTSWLLALAAALVAPAVSAQEIKKVEKLEPVVVSATKLEAPAAQLGAAVTVITDEDFKTFHYESVTDALRTVPGVEIQRFGGPGKLSTVRIRGANAQQVQILIDGARVKNPTGGTFDFSDLSPDLIERIEVIRGPQSTLYGADAIGGVINIITRKGRGPFGATASQEAGTHDTLRSRAEVSGAYRMLDYAFSASHFETTGQFKNDNADVDAFSTRLGLSLPWDSSLAFMGRWNDSYTRLPIRSPFAAPQPIGPLLDENSRQHSQTLTTTLKAHTRPVTWWESDLRLSRFRNRTTFDDGPDTGVGCPNLVFGFPCEFPSITTVLRREAEWVNHFHVGRASTSSLGLEHIHDEGTAEVSTPFRARTNTGAFFFQQQFRVWDRLFMSGGVRIEDHSVFGTVTTERGSLAFVVKETGTRLRGGAGSGFRAPTFVDLFFPGFANPSLRPESSFSYDFGVDQRLWHERIRLGLTYYQNTFTDLITCCGSPTPAAPFGGPINIGRARAAGIEFTSEADLLDTLVASVNYTYNDSENLSTDRPLPRQARHLWSVGLTWEPVKRLSLFTQVHTSSRQFDTFGNVYNTGHTRVDLGGTYRLVDRYGFLQALDATARVQNLLNEEYAEVRGFPALGRTALVGLRAQF